MDRASIYDFAGGEAAFLRLAAAHHERCLQDSELNHPLSHGVNPEHVERLGRYWAEVFGGPPLYSERHGGQPAMLRIHAGKGAGEEYAPRFMACFVQAADEAGLPADAELRSALRAYMEWAVTDVLQYAPAGSRVAESAPLPHWTWHGRE